MSKSDGSAGRAFALIALILFIAGAIPLGGSGSSPDGGAIPTRDYIIDGRNITGNVQIGADSVLVTFVGFLKGTGKGSEEDPFIVDGWSFEGSDNCLEFFYTYSHIIIRNCSFFNDGHSCYGIFLTGTKNVVIEDCIFHNLSIGISADSSQFTFDNNQIENLYNTGIRAYSSNISVNGNEIYNIDGYGISTNNCIGDVRNNYIYNNSDYGLNLDVGLVVENNTLINNGILVFDPIPDSNTVNGRPILLIKNDTGHNYTGNYAQVIIINCTDIRISDMNIYNTTTGIYAVSNSISINNCTISNCVTAIHAYCNVNVRSCIFFGNGFAIQSAGYDGILDCKQSIFTNNQNCIHAHQYRFIIDNDFINSTQVAIYIDRPNMISSIHEILFNFIDKATTGVYIVDYFENIHNISCNIIQRANIGVFLKKGNIVLCENRIEESGSASVYSYDSIGFFRNQLMGKGINYQGGEIKSDGDNTLNGFSIIIKRYEHDNLTSPLD
jgi:parallel beta-helix repeat protein